MADNAEMSRQNIDRALLKEYGALLTSHAALLKAHLFVA